MADRLTQSNFPAWFYKGLFLLKNSASTYLSTPITAFNESSLSSQWKHIVFA